MICQVSFASLAPLGGEPISRFTPFSIIVPGIPEIRAIGGQILKTPMVIKPSNQSKLALSLT
jgi:hypothetical protein